MRVPIHRTSGVPAPLRVVFDRTVREGRAFGVTAQGSGARVDGVDSDLGRFWMSTLEPLLRQGPLALAGLTTGASLFCLELLCRDYGLRTVYRIEHAFGPDGRIRHALAGDPSLAAWPERLAAAGAEWPAAAAVVALEAARQWQPASAIDLLDLREHERTAQSLFTWVIKNRA